MKRNWEIAFVEKYQKHVSLDLCDKNLQLAAVQKNGSLIRHIRNPSEELRLEAVTRYGLRGLAHLRRLTGRHAIPGAEEATGRPKRHTAPQLCRRAELVRGAETPHPREVAERSRARASKKPLARAPTCHYRFFAVFFAAFFAVFFFAPAARLPPRPPFFSPIAYSC